jgi:hypothetical protein
MSICDYNTINMYILYTDRLSQKNVVVFSAFIYSATIASKTVITEMLFLMETFKISAVCAQTPPTLW